MPAEVSAYDTQAEAGQLVALLAATQMWQPVYRLLQMQMYST